MKPLLSTVIPICLFCAWTFSHAQQQQSRIPQGNSNRNSSLPQAGLPGSRPKVQPIEPSSREDTKELKKSIMKWLKTAYGKSEPFELQDVKARTISGETAAGVEIGKTSETITIDTTPCSKKKRTITFHKEYDTEDVSSEHCNGKERKRIQVTQK